MKKFALILPTIALLSACGGSDSNEGTVNPPNPPPVSQLPEIIEGELTALNKATGAATVGRYNVDFGHLKQTRSTIETIDNLALGMVLTLHTDGNQTVQSIIYDDLLVAPVTAFDAESKMLTMAGKSVMTQGAKLETGLVLDASVVGKVLEISGFTVDQNTIQASYIELEEHNVQPGGDVVGEIEGVITNLNATAKTFNLGTMIVNYSNINVPFILQNGQWVEVSGSFKDSTIIAIEVELEDYDYGDNTSIEVEGRVTQVSTDKTTGRVTKLLLNGSRTIELPANAVKYEDFPYNGAHPVIKPDMFIEVKGRWINNTIQAIEVECNYGCENTPVIPPTTPPTTSPSTTGEFNVEGLASYSKATNTITLNGFTFIVSQFAEWEDIHPANWNTPTWVSLSGMMDSQSNLVWEVENEFNSEPEIDLEGVVTIVDGSYSLWGYHSVDNSLKDITARWGLRVEVVCRFNQTNNTISFCQFDD